MAQIGRYKIPRPFKDEDRWFKFFTKDQLLWIGLALIISFRLVTWVMYSSKVVLFITLVGCVVFVIATAVIAMCSMPTDKYLWGGGIPLKKLVVRLIRKRLKANRQLYVKNYNAEGKGGN